MKRKTGKTKDKSVSITQYTSKGKYKVNHILNVIFSDAKEFNQVKECQRYYITKTTFGTKVTKNCVSSSHITK